MNENYYAIEGFDNIYQGLHGMIEREVFFGTFQEAMDVMRELSQEVMGSYNEIEENLEETVREICDDEEIDYMSDEADEIRGNVWEENIDGNIYKLKTEELPTKDIEVLSESFWNDPEDFLEKYAE